MGVCRQTYTASNQCDSKRLVLTPGCDRERLLGIDLEVPGRSEYRARVAPGCVSGLMGKDLTRDGISG